ncbi:MAG: dihydrofolate reductase [Clostridia bacterium]|nr:dihydrofolate reductase [Clostridia bacterium]
MIKAIVCVDKNWGIGKDNDLLFSLPSDMKFFRETTLGKTVVMGGNTLRSFPGGNPLKNRQNIVISRTQVRDDCIITPTMDAFLAEIRARKDEDVYVIGGAQIYREMLPYCEEILATKVDADGGATAFFPDLDAHPDFACVFEGERREENGLSFRFTRYQNANPKTL